MPLHRITVYYETDSADDADELVAKFERAICPFDAADPHDCPHRWTVITNELDTDEAAELESLLNS